MNSKVVVIIAVVAVVALVAMGALAYSFLREPEAASGPIEAIPIVTSDQEPAVTAGAEVAEATDIPELEASAVAPEATVGTKAPTEAAQPTQLVAKPTETSPPSDESSTTQGVFEIIPAESEARFIIEEVLRGSPTTVVGSTGQVAGQLAVDPSDLSAAQVGVIQVNARTLTTDNQFRNRAIKNRILLTDQHEFVTFTPTEVVGLSGAGSVGEAYEFRIVGELTITDLTREVTFVVTVTPVSDTRLEGLATTAFLYTDFELAIPDAPAVDTVEDEVRLEFEFAAEALP